jgi:hypothetical protein
MKNGQTQYNNVIHEFIIKKIKTLQKNEGLVIIPLMGEVSFLVYN